MSDSNKKQGSQILRAKLQKSLRERLSKKGGPASASDPAFSEAFAEEAPASEEDFLASLDADVSREIAVFDPQSAAGFQSGPDKQKTASIPNPPSSVTEPSAPSAAANPIPSAATAETSGSSAAPNPKPSPDKPEPSRSSSASSPTPSAEAETPPAAVSSRKRESRPSREPPPVFSPFSSEDPASLLSHRMNPSSEPKIFTPEAEALSSKSEPSRRVSRSRMDSGENGFAQPPPIHAPEFELAPKPEARQDIPSPNFGAGPLTTSPSTEEHPMTDESQNPDRPEKKTAQRPATTLRAPAPQRKEEPDPDNHQDPLQKRRDAGLRQPSAKGISKPSYESDPEASRFAPPSSSKTHEQEIFEAIRAEDIEWIRTQARSSDIQSSRQEILMVAALPKAHILSALIEIGFSFDADGLAVKTAISKGYWNCVESFQRAGARFDVDTLKKIAAWRREIAQKAARTMRRDAPPPRQQPQAEEPISAPPESLDSEFAQFLDDHGSVASEGLPGDHDDIDSDLEAHLESGQSSKIARNPPVDDFEEETAPGSSENSGFDISDELEAALGGGDDEPPPSDPVVAPRRPAPSPTSASPPPRMAAHESGAGSLSALERAKLKTLERVMAEKQALENRVMELEAFAEAVETLEAEREGFFNQLDEAAAERDRLLAQLRAAESGSKQRDRALEEAHGKELDRLRVAEQNLSSMLEQTEADLSSSQERERELLARVDELERMDAPPPEAVDILLRDGLDKTLRKSLFVSQILKGEIHTLEKIALNSSVEREEASYALAFAAEAGQIEAAEWILRNLDGDLHIGGELPLLRALESGQVEMAFWLIGRGANFHHADEFALRWACKMEDIETIDRLVSLGASVHAGGGRPLREAFASESWRAFRALLCYGASPLAPNGDVDSEFASSPEALEIIQWSESQRKALQQIDPDFLDRIMASKK